MSQDLVAATDPKLLQRLLRPIERPGVIDSGMGWEIVARSQQFTNRLPLVFDLTRRWNPKIGFQGEKIPIVYAQPQPQESPTTGSISAELGQSPSSQRTVVQAKFVNERDRTHQLVRTTNPNAGETPTPQEFLATNPRSENFPSSQPMVVQAKFVNERHRTHQLVQTTNPNAGETPTPQEFLATNPRSENFPSSQPMVVQAKFMSGTDGSLLSPKPTPISATLPNEKPPHEQISLNSANLLLETQAITDLSRETSQNPIPIVQARSQPLPAGDSGISLRENLPSVQELKGGAIAFDSITALPNLSEETIQNPKSVLESFERQKPMLRFSAKSQNPISWSGLEIPLLFSHQVVNPESVQAELAVPNPGITGMSRNQPMTQTTGLSREVSLHLQSHQESNIQQPNIETPIDLEALTDKVERNLMQRLIIESERRGRTTWS
ncbi:MAG: hypothetical protein RM338_06680 [Nostoc sp. DedQUE12a]|nr:hypothetical protein [Nostoc sp. DedQUE12a]